MLRWYLAGQLRLTQLAGLHTLVGSERSHNVHFYLILLLPRLIRFRRGSCCTKKLLLPCCRKVLFLSGRKLLPFDKKVQKIFIFLEVRRMLELDCCTLAGFPLVDRILNRCHEECQCYKGYHGQPGKKSVLGGTASSPRTIDH